MNTISCPSPTKAFELKPSTGAPGAQVLLFGRPTDWRGDEQSFSLQPTLEEHGAKRLFLIDPAKCDALVYPTHAFLRKPSAPFPFFSRYAEGIILDTAGDAAFIKPADCPTIVMIDGAGRIVVGHGALNALIDRAIVHHSGEARKPTGVITSMLAPFEVNARHELTVYVILGIGPDSFRNFFTDPTHGRKNLELMSYLKDKFPLSVVEGDGGYSIDLFEIIKARCLAAGVKKENINRDRYDTFTDVDRVTGQEPQYMWHSNRRDGTASGRNAVVVIR